MPLPPYKRFHPEAVVTPEQLMVLKSYLNPEARKEAATAGEINAATGQYDKWIQSGDVTPNVAPAPNGIAFLPEYKNWKAISSTERFDNQTLRQILGNDVAAKANAANHNNPRPDRAEVEQVRRP